MQQGQVADRMQIVDDGLVPDQDPLASAASMAGMVGGVDRRSGAIQGAGHPLVAARVLAVAVAEHGDPLRGGRARDRPTRSPAWPARMKSTESGTAESLGSLLIGS